MIPYNADWRWTFGLPDCPLYPSVRLYRQKQPFAWEPVVDAICADLARRIADLPRHGSLELARQARDTQQWETARHAYRACLAHDPDSSEALAGIGACLQMQNKSLEAVAWYGQALQQQPEDPALHCNRALALLTLGRYKEGWQELQWRKKLITESLPPIPFLTPAGLMRIAGKRLLLHTEQGFGDTIQMLRYLPLLTELGATPILSLPQPLMRLAAAQPAVHQVIPHGDRLPAADYQILLQDLPWLFSTTVETVPAETPYLLVPEHLRTIWQRRMNTSAGLKVGLAWSCGGGDQRNRRLRSMPFNDLAPLLELSQIQFYSLQIGPNALSDQQRSQYPNLHDLSHLVADFADTAALILALDYVISVDTAVAHLAGALGKPVLLVLPSFREWRWIAQGTRSVWYPTVKTISSTDLDSGRDAVILEAQRLLTQQNGV
jgi:hypothetical protein